MSQLNNKPIAHIYNPMNQDKQSLVDNFVIRQREFLKIFKEIQTGKLNQVSQNYIVQGQRGTGKTTLLARLKYEIEGDDSLIHLIPIQFSEEQYNIFSLNRFWENVAEILEEEPGFEDIVDQMEELDDEEDFFYLIGKSLKKNKKKLVLLIDNFGDILDKLPGNEPKKLRDLLHESDLQIIAGSTRALEIAYKYDKPFFESFKTIFLSPLTSDDVQILLKNLCGQYQQKNVYKILEKEKGRIETIRRLTGGVPRTIILLFEIFLDDSASVFEDLEGILDKITPLYKHKMDDLPTQQQVIVDAIALNWDGMLTSEIAKKTKIETKKIAAQMKGLEKSGFIKSVLINKKNKLYMLDERFFNIWYLMRYGRKKKKQQVQWLVSFLTDWCSNEELMQRAKNHIILAKQGKLHKRGGYFMAEALFQSVRDPQLQYMDGATPPGVFAKAVIGLRSGAYKDSIEYFQSFLSSIKDSDDCQGHIQNYLMVLMSRKQFHLCLSLFQDQKYNLKERFKPMYYALMYFMQEEYPKEFKRMGEEFRETVEEIVQTIEGL